MNIKFWSERLWLSVSYLFRPMLVGTICGHKTKKEGVIAAFGDTTIVQMPVGESGHPEYCLSCISDMAVRCTWCGRTIHIGSPVTLYIPTDESFVPPDYAVRHIQDKRCFVGCLRWGCADTGADMQGRWMPPGKVERCLSPVELALRGNVVLVPELQHYPDGVVLMPHEQ